MKTMFLYLVLVVGMISSLVQSDENISQHEIRKLVERGELLALETILSRYPEKQYGKLLDLEVEWEQGKIIYELEFLHTDGRVIELEIDARNGLLLKQEGDD